MLLLLDMMAEVALNVMSLCVSVYVCVCVQKICKFCAVNFRVVENRVESGIYAVH